MDTAQCASQPCLAAQLVEAPSVEERSRWLSTDVLPCREQVGPGGSMREGPVSSSSSALSGQGVVSALPFVMLPRPVQICTQLPQGLGPVLSHPQRTPCRWCLCISGSALGGVGLGCSLSLEGCYLSTFTIGVRGWVQGAHLG